MGYERLKRWIIVRLIWLIVFTAAPPDCLAEEETSGGTASELLAGGEQAFLQKDFELAEELLGKFLEDYGENSQVAEQAKLVKPLLALVRVRLKKFENAGGLIDEALELDSITDEQREELAFWKGVVSLKTGDHAGAQEAFGEFYATEAHAWWRRVEALLMFGTTDVLRGNYADAAAFFESQMPKLRERAPEAAGRAVVLRLHALSASGSDAEALALLKEEYPRMDRITQLVSFQSLAVALGNKFLESGEYYRAIACLQRVWRKDRLLRHQQVRLEDIRGRIVAIRERGGAAEMVFQLEGMVTRLEREVANFEKGEGFDASVRLRLATAFRGLGRFRESALILEEMLEEMEPDALVEQAALALVQSWMQVGRWPRAIAAAERYEELFGVGGGAKSLPLVSFLKAECELEAKSHQAASASYARVFAEWPDSEVAPKAFFMMGMAMLMADKNEAAINGMREFRKTYPEHPLVEDSVYWEGMGYSFEREHGGCFEVMGGYLEKYPEGKYAGDAAFRMAFCRHSDAWYDEAIDGFRVFIENFPDSKYTDEAHLLLGDALGATGEIEAAIAAYRAIDLASLRFFEDGWFKIGKALWLTERAEEMRRHMEEFIQRFPESFRVAEAVYEIGKIDVKAGEPEKAKESYWRTLREIGNDADAYAIEDVIVAMPKLYAGASGAVDLAQDFDGLRRWGEGEGKLTVVLRAHWGRAKALARRSPELAGVSMADAGSLVDAKLHNPRITVDCAEARRQSGKPLVAAKLYREAKKWHPRTPDKDRIYAGLGYLARDEGKRGEASDWFEKAEKVTFRPALKAEVMLARAELQAERVPHLAREILDALLGDKVLGSGAKAEALLLYAEILEKEGKKRKALAYYERVYVAYGKYRALVAKAYLRRAKLLEELGMSDEAAEVYREIVGRGELSEFDEWKVARKRYGEREGGAE